MTHVEAASTRLRTVMLNFAFVGAFLVLVPVIGSQFWRNEVLIDRIPVPGAMAAIGLTPEVAANRLWDGLRDATLRANTSKNTVTALPDAERIEFSLPETGFSVESLIQQTRAFFHAYQTRITGEFTCATSACDPREMRLRLRVLTGTSKLIDMPPIGDLGLRDYFTAAGVQILSVLDPFVAIASIAEQEPLRATVLARNLIRQHHPDAKWAHVLIGIMKDEPGDMDASIEAFREALLLDPDFFIARRNLASRLVSAGRFEEARQEYAALERNWANDAAVVAGKGELAFAEGKFDDAAALYARAAALDPREPLYVARQGDAALGRGESASGVGLLQKALQMDPAFPPAMASLTGYYFSTGDIFETREVFANYAEMAPDVADAQAMYGQVLRYNGDSQAGLDYLQKAQALAPERTDIAEAVGSTQIELGALDAAEMTFRRLLALVPDHAAAYAELGKIYNFKGERDRAVEAWRQAAALEPANPAYLAGTGEVLMYSRRYNEAIEQFDRALELAPDRPETWSFKGATLKHMGRDAEAVAALERFLELAEGRPEYLALRQLAQGDIDAIRARGAAP